MNEADPGRRPTHQGGGRGAEIELIVTKQELNFGW
jgi:hypothetical protein